MEKYGNPTTEDAFIDSGADTGCLGKGFHIVNVDDFRTINIHGCKEEFVVIESQTVNGFQQCTKLYLLTMVRPDRGKHNNQLTRIHNKTNK